MSASGTWQKTRGESARRRRRKRRERSGPPRGLLLLPHLLTTAGLGFGFFAIVMAFAGTNDLAASAIVFAMLCDVFDGRVARLAKSTSKFGGEYDSIADTVSFAVAPAMLAVSAGNLQVLGRAGWVMAFLYTACAALRLARFNVSPSRYRGRFEGLPSPAAAGVIATTQLFVSFLRERGVAIDVPEFLIAGATAMLGPADGQLDSLSQLQGARRAALLPHPRLRGLRDRAGDPGAVRELFCDRDHLHVAPRPDRVAVAAAIGPRSKRSHGCRSPTETPQG